MSLHNQAIMNRIWSQVLLEELSRLGVSEVCIAPGSRSTPLTLEAHQNNKLKLHTHFDERGLGFLALGLAKASDKPVALIVTSGTAVANLLPAIAEAKLTGEKLVVLTADRPVELVGCGANQAINQVGIFSSHVSATLELPSPSESVALKWLLTSIDQKMSEQAEQGGAIHINCPFPEPLYGSESKGIFQAYLDEVKTWLHSDMPYSCKVRTQSLPSLHDVSSSDKPGVIVVGSVTLEEAQQAKQLAETLGWPCLCDPQSGVSSPFAHYDLWLQNSTAQAVLNQARVIVQFGSRIVSKRLNQWISQQVESRQADYHYVSPQVDRNNQNHLPQTHHVVGIGVWIESWLRERVGGKNVHYGWAKELEHYSQCAVALSEQSHQSVNEIALAKSVKDLPQPTQVFLGNSLFVRLVDMFGSMPNLETFSNRGASGIDGLIATAAGVVRANPQPSVLFIGDTSALYDLNSLSLLTHEKTPLVIVVVNNDGGAIFDLLPVPQAQKQPLYQMPHGYTFEHAAMQFGIRYQKPTTLAAYSELVSHHLQQGEGALLVEVQTPPEQASSQLKEITQRLHAL
ncbi:2-succinyl-5-enolpyruvyl-6-hydroxy-3-cyclohexene-1-carboxylic-acid synthase [Vibrio sp. Isolate24]|uniref:2-succinyl-5-enolpyruvyl-6-hydroxy-3- cyclohexene-1-carboxylic-acid synthase n=1 Tax=Vibrio sp. Isolate24 TaxID=2908534 RepID=UPI001EFC48F6|nr:2-succinyl-5-enolpyruvyl-6-hydroxy-3-cyclohexene-1-carboxylic-acid synthase [Vibrio sp. Isolate24]MCG9678499.1 2-succinyl-5-enolpyruvyl-6-hydroxy-3-cyclohexene-1-carboxylic-acid synthase [Vibrio sp. Isolate24]